MFRLQARGEDAIEVCTDLSCALGGADELLEHDLPASSASKPGETTRRRQVHREAGRVPGRLRRRARGAGERRVARARDRGRPRPRPRRRDGRRAASTGRRARASTILLGTSGRRTRPRSRSTRRAAATRTSKKYLTMTPEDDHRRGQEVEPARARRRRLPDRAEVELPAQGQPEAALPVRERRRERAGHLQGPRDPRARPAPAHRGDASSRRHAIRSKIGLHLHPRRVPRGRPHAREGASPRPTPPGYVGQEHPRHRRRRRHRTSTAAPAPTSAARRRRSSRASRASAASRASSRRSRRSSASTAARPSSTTSRRSPACRSSSSAGAEWFAAYGHREERRAQALLRSAAT